MRIKTSEKEPKYFHCYATANESILYLKDIQNLKRIKDVYSGYNKVVLFIAISEVKNISFYDKFFIKMIEELFYNHPTIELKSIYFKSNVGRDFSSFQSLYFKVKQTANLNDFIFFQNRSGFGPFKKDWYKQFVKQFEKFDSIAICGSTINFNDHPKRSLNNNLPHIQTYSFLTKVFFMDMLKDDFPGSKETEKKEIICKGEIGLSQFFLEKNYKITCIELPNEEISNQSKPIVLKDVKRRVTESHYFYHRDYFKKKLIIKSNQMIQGLITWVCFYFRSDKKQVRASKCVCESRLDKIQ